MMRSLQGGILLMLLAIAGDAGAQADERPEQLFREAKQLMTDGRHAEACPLLEESQRLDPAGGTLLTLALCHEAVGKTATAHEEFVAAADLARRDKRDDRLAIAEDHAKALLPRLCRLSIRLHEITAGIEVEHNGTRLNAHEWEGNVDPGRHTVRATAPDKKPFVETVELSTDGARAEIVVPALAPLPKHVVKPKPRPIAHAKPEPSAEGPRPLTIAGIASGGVGVVALGIGTYFGIRAVLDRSEANDLCPDVQCSNQDAVDLNDDAQRAAGWSTGLLVGGSVVVATGIVLLVLSETETVKLTAHDRLAIRW